MINLNTDIPLDIGKFWRWWTTELRTLVPPSFFELIKRKQDFLVLTKIAGAIKLTHVGDGVSRNLGVFALNTDGKRAQHLLFAEHKELADTEIILRLSSEQGLLKVFKLPAATQENLAKVVAFEMDRQTPFNADQVYYDARVVETLANANQIKVELALVLRSSLDEMLQELFDWGLRPNIVDMAPADEEQDFSKPSYNLLPEASRSKQRNLPKLFNIALSVVLCLLLSLILIIPILANKSYLSNLEIEVSRIGKVANRVQSMKKQADTQLKELGFLLEKKRSDPIMMETLEELTKLIPDNSWLTNFDYKNKRLKIQGQSPAASLLIETIETSPLFQNTNFVSPVTQDRRTKLERFQIVTEVVNKRINGRTADSKS